MKINQYFFYGIVRDKSSDSKNKNTLKYILKEKT